jgi:hypothetical protein
MISLTLMCWRKVISNSTAVFQDAYPGWPPVKIYPDGLDLEFAPLLLADIVHMDSSSYEQLARETPAGMERAVGSLKKLQEEGYLKLVDYTQRLLDIQRNVLDATNARLGTPELFLDPVRRAVATWDAEGPKYAAALNRPHDFIATLPVGIVAALAAEGHSAGVENVARIRKVLSKKAKTTRLERDLLREVARPYIDHAHTGIALYRNIGAPVVDWSDLGPVYEALLYLSIEPAKPLQKKIPKLRELFRAGLSAFEPSNVEEFLKIIRDPRLLDLRNFIEEAEARNVSFDAKFIQDTLIQISRRTRIFSRAGTTINAVGVGAGAVAAFFDGGLTAGILVTMGIGAGQEVAADTVTNLLTKNLKWILCLVDAKGTVK